MANVRMYTTAWCGYCRAAKRFLAQVKGVHVQEIDITDQPEQRKALAEQTGQVTVPQIFIGETHVGGYTELRALDAAGGLDSLLSSEA
ncbi:MAG: glutaredoxin 3 [Myxococcota bacterium]